MKTKIAVRILLLLSITILVFHISILLKIAPQEIIWGGKLGSEAEMYLLESISIFGTLYLMLILLIKGSLIRPVVSPKVVSFSLWVFLILFILNTIGNVFARTTLEQTFALISMAISVMLWIILRK
jgi:hypothetical protein